MTLKAVEWLNVLTHCQKAKGIQQGSPCGDSERGFSSIFCACGCWPATLAGMPPIQISQHPKSAVQCNGMCPLLFTGDSEKNVTFTLYITHLVYNQHIVSIDRQTAVRHKHPSDLRHLTLWHCSQPLVASLTFQINTHGTKRCSQHVNSLILHVKMLTFVIVIPTNY